MRRYGIEQKNNQINASFIKAKQKTEQNNKGEKKMKFKKLIAMSAVLAMFASAVPVLAAEPTLDYTQNVVELSQIDDTAVVTADNSEIQLFDAGETVASEGTVNDLEAFKNAVETDGAYIKLGADISAAVSEGNNEINLPCADNITIDLNGKTLTMDKVRLLVPKDKTLTIKDSAENGKIYSETNSILIYTYGSVNIEGGTIEAPNSVAVVSCGTFEDGVLTAKANINMTGGNITAYQGVKSQLGSNFTMTGGSITTNTIPADDEEGTKAKNDIAVIGLYGGSVKITGGEVNAEYCGVAVYGYDSGYDCCGICEMTIDGEAKISGTYGVTVWYKGILNVKNGTIASNGIAVCGNGTDHSGTTINISGGEITSEGTGIYHPQYGTLTITGGSIIADSAAIEIESGNLNISGGLFKATSDDPGFLNPKDGDGTTVSGVALAMVCRSNANRTGYYGDINANITGGQFEGIYGAAKYLYKGSDEATSMEGLNIAGGTFICTDETNGGAFAVADDCIEKNFITGGNFSTDVSQYVVNDNFFQDNSGNVMKSATTVIDTAKAGANIVTLNGLRSTLESMDSETIANEGEAVTYKTVLDAPSAEAKTAADNITSEKDTKETVDISIVKVIDGKEIPVEVKNQEVTLKLGAPAAEGSEVEVYHIEDNTPVKIQSVEVSGDRRYVTFTAPSFSPYTVIYNAAAQDSENITDTITLAFEKVDESVDGEYNILLKAADGKQINRFFAADITFEPEFTDGVLAYDITPVMGVSVSNQGDDRWLFNMNGSPYYSITGEDIVIGKVKINGYGNYTFKADTAADTNVVRTAESANNIVGTYTPSAETSENNFLLDNGIVSGTLKQPTSSLTINVMFPNDVSDNGAEYEKMSVTVEGGAGFSKTIALGNDGEAEYTQIEEYNGYTASVEVPMNLRYTLTFSGDGYRTYKTTVTPTESTSSVTVWNNVMDEDQTIVKVGETAGASAKVTFLAGDIVKDGNINLYDLSAVVSYFGKTDLKEDTNKDAYIQYDLNRDGKIDSKDIAMVLVSWNN